jgi:hypothetical protein
VDYYPINKHTSLEHLFKRWRINKIFPLLTEKDIEELLIWHVDKNLIRAYTLDCDKEKLIKLTYFINPGNSQDKKVVTYKITITDKGVEKIVPKSRVRHYLYDVYLSKENVKSFEAGQFNAAGKECKTMRKPEKRSLALKAFLRDNPDAFYYGIKAQGAWDLLNKYDSAMFPIRGIDSIRDFFSDNKIKFKLGRRPN